MPLDREGRVVRWDKDSNPAPMDQWYPKKKSTEKTVISFATDGKTYNSLVALAVKYNMTRSDVMNKIVGEFLAENEEP